jgi:hypothetical protein
MAVRAYLCGVTISSVEVDWFGGALPLAAAQIAEFIRHKLLTECEVGPDVSIDWGANR